MKNIMLELHFTKGWKTPDMGWQTHVHCQDIKPNTMSSTTFPIAAKFPAFNYVHINHVTYRPKSIIEIKMVSLLFTVFILQLVAHIINSVGASAFNDIVCLHYHPLTL